MRDIFLVTRKRMTWEDCGAALTAAFSDDDGNETGVRIGRSPRTVQIWFEADEKAAKLYDTRAGGSDFPSGVKRLVPQEDPYCTNAEFHREKDVCAVVSVLLPLYPDLFLIDEDDRVFSAAEYLALYGQK